MWAIDRKKALSLVKKRGNRAANKCFYSCPIPTKSRTDSTRLSSPCLLMSGVSPAKTVVVNSSKASDRDESSFLILIFSFVYS